MSSKSKIEKVEKLAPINFGELSVAALNDLADKAKAALEAKREAERDGLRTKITALCDAAGTNVADLFGYNRAKRGRKAGTVGVAKYRNPSDPTQTWTGAGRTPNWLIEAEKAGASRDSFLIK